MKREELRDSFFLPISNFYGEIDKKDFSTYSNEYIKYLEDKILSWPDPSKAIKQLIVKDSKLLILLEDGTIWQEASSSLVTINNKHTYKDSNFIEIKVNLHK